MADTFELELVSPEKLLLSQPAEMVVVPGAEGDFGVLPGHAPMIATIRPGALTVFEGGAVKQRIFVAGGFAEVASGRCTILAAGVVPLDDIDRGAAEQEVRNLKEDVATAEDEAAAARAREALAVVEARLQVLDAPPYS